jgi:hypothetical protein
MARKVIGPTGSRRRRWLLLSCLFVAAASAVVFIPGALANSVKTLTFEVSDANIAQNDTATPKYDWANFFNSSGARSPVLPDATRPGYTASSFVKDFNTKTDRKGNTVFDTADASTYTIGSKDILDVNGWSCTPANNVTDKGDIMNAYAVAYTDPSSGHKFMFFALERNANAGDANVAFWFLGGSASCPAAGGSFTGTHQDGDLLVVSAFTNGGSVSTINAYEWQNGALNTTPVAAGGDCRDTTLTGDPTCAVSNTTALTGIPWQTMNKTDGVGHTLQSGEFFEGGIDLSAPSVGLANKCFNTFIPDTRSSQSLTATLYDFALGSLGECSSSIVTTPKASDGTSAPPTSIGTAGSVDVKDSASLKVDGVDTWAGTVTFSICGPLANATDNCASGGTQVGDPVAVDQDTTNPQTVLSPTKTITTAGRYCWRAHFHATTPATGIPDADDPKSDSTSLSECFTLAPVAPTLSTTPSNSSDATAASCCSTPLDDTITLSGTANKPDGSAAGGTITVRLYGPSATAVCTDPATGVTGNRVAVVTIAVTGDSSASNLYKASTGTLVSGSLTPSGPGHYWWTASYSGDSPNTLPAPKDASNNATFTACGDEESFVSQIPTTVITKQSWYPNDTATIASTVGNLAGGHVDFALYNNADCTAGTNNVNILYTERQSIGSSGSSQEVKTHNYFGSTALTPGGLTVSPFSVDTGYTDAANSVKPSSSTKYSWKVVFTPDDQGHTGIQSACTETHSITYTNDNSGGTSLP